MRIFNNRTNRIWWRLMAMRQPHMDCLGIRSAKGFSSQSSEARSAPKLFRKDRVKQYESKEDPDNKPAQNLESGTAAMDSTDAVKENEHETILGRPGGGSVVEDAFARYATNKLSPPPMKDDEVLLFQTRKPGKYKVLVVTGAVPGIFGILELVMNLSGAQYPLPPWQITLGIGSSIVLYGMSWRAMKGEIESMVLCSGGTHVRMRPFNIAGRPGKPDVTVPIRLLREKRQSSDKASKARLFTMEGDKDPGQQKTMHHMILDFRNDEVFVHDDQILDLVLSGSPLETRHHDGNTEIVGRKKKEDPSVYWKKAHDKEGREYWWHEITRETRWEPPVSDVSTS
eukprot:gb/GECG01015306.1/.p1 GENE.gb/GECG01015306.1/~~gb/GECG01015306.1/.p1  ORF type:complete len:341 (+),score=44.60 gb/GECG01015306.1/:1-1023(+)